MKKLFLHISLCLCTLEPNLLCREMCAEMRIYMAKYAYCIPNGSEKDKVDAEKLPLHGNGVFYCTTPNCRARMYVRSPQKKSACFVSFNVEEHTGGILCHLKDCFKPDQYDETLFSLERFYNRLFSQNHNDVTPHYGSGGCGNNQSIPINTLRMLYLMCIQFRDGGSYNGYEIDKILIDKMNFHNYIASGIHGNFIIACTFWKYDKSTKIIYMNCPDDLIDLPQWNHKIFKVHVNNVEMFNKCVKKLTDKTHLHISIIAGHWISSSDNECFAECEIYSVGKQICKGY